MSPDEGTLDRSDSADCNAQIHYRRPEHRRDIACNQPLAQRTQPPPRLQAWNGERLRAAVPENTNCIQIRQFPLRRKSCEIFGGNLGASAHHTWCKMHLAPEMFPSNLDTRAGSRHASHWSISPSVSLD